MTQKNDNSVSSEVKERLQKLFTDDNGADDEYLFQDSEDSIDHELKELKAVVLSIDWEITDEIMSTLINQIETLKKVYQHDRILILFLQLLGTVGKYIQIKKANAHPDSIKLLNSTYQSFEKAVINKQLSDSDRKKLLQTQVNRFKELKDQIMEKSEAPANGIGREKNEKLAPVKDQIDIANSQMTPQMAIAIEEIKKIIHDEFKSLKADLQAWIEEKRL